MTFEEHRDSIIKRWSEAASAKYEAGQREHGGELWNKPTLGEAIAESVDLPVYLYTLQDTLRSVVAGLRIALQEKEWWVVESAIARLEREVK